MVFQRRTSDASVLSEPIKLAFSHLNLRFNPFGELDISAWRKIVIADVDACIPLLKNPGNVVQFIGGMGRGKTSHLFALWNHFSEASYVYVEEDASPRFPVSQPLIVDEIQRLSRRERYRLFKRPISFAVGTHVDYTSEMIKAGLKVKTMEVEANLSADRLCRIWQNRIENARRNCSPVPVITHKAAKRLMELYGTDIRAMECELYSTFQSLKEKGDVKM
jgi:hypothetical protein